MFGAQSTGTASAARSSAPTVASSRFVVPLTIATRCRAARLKSSLTAPATEKSTTTSAPSKLDATSGRALDAEMPYPGELTEIAPLGRVVRRTRRADDLEVVRLVAQARDRDAHAPGRAVEGELHEAS